MRRWSRGLGMLLRLEPGPSLGGWLSSAAEPGSGSQEIFDRNAPALLLTLCATDDKRGPITT